jgi:hypothetical protein
MTITNRARQKPKKAKTKTKNTEAKTNLLFVAGSKEHKDL